MDFINKEGLKKELIKETNNFNLTKFFDDNIDDSCLILITPYQVVKTVIPRGATHTVTLQEIYMIMYKGFRGTSYKELWDTEIIKHNHIVLRIANMTYTDVHVPEKINTFQLEELIKVNNEIKKVTRKNKPKLIYYLNNEEYMSNNLDPLIKNALNNIDDNINLEEKILDKNKGSKSL